MKTLLKGRAHKFGHNINTDEIIPAKFLNVSQDKELARHCLAGLADRRSSFRADRRASFRAESFTRRIKRDDIIVAGNNFGCGSSREHAPRAIKAAGISCVIARSFARIFFRNAVNIGLPIVESKLAAEKIQNGHLIEINLEKGEIKNLSHIENYQFKPFPEFLQQIIASGGLMGMVKKDKNAKGKRKKSTGLTGLKTG